jgi:hypothetical protein
MIWVDDDLKPSSEWLEHEECKIYYNIARTSTCDSISLPLFGLFSMQTLMLVVDLNPYGNSDWSLLFKLMGLTAHGKQVVKEIISFLSLCIMHYLGSGIQPRSI